MLAFTGSANANWPKGIISHIAGFDSDGMYVVDVWESQRDFDTFVDSRLKPAFEAVGGLPMPSVTTFVVHNVTVLERIVDCRP